MASRCAVVGCNNPIGGYGGHRFIRLPMNVERRERWVEALRRNQPTFQPNPFTCICYEHFKETDYHSLPDTGRKMLHPWAVPSVFPGKRYRQNIAGLRSIRPKPLPLSSSTPPPPTAAASQACLSAAANVPTSGEGENGQFLSARVDPTRLHEYVTPSWTLHIPQTEAVAMNSPGLSVGPVEVKQEPISVHDESTCSTAVPLPEKFKEEPVETDCPLDHVDVKMEDVGSCEVPASQTELLAEQCVYLKEEAIDHSKNTSNGTEHEFVSASNDIGDDETAKMSKAVPGDAFVESGSVSFYDSSATNGNTHNSQTMADPLFPSFPDTNSVRRIILQDSRVANELTNSNDPLAVTNVLNRLAKSTGKSSCKDKINVQLAGWPRARKINVQLANLLPANPSVEEKEEEKEEENKNDETAVELTVSLKSDDPLRIAQLKAELLALNLRRTSLKQELDEERKQTQKYKAKSLRAKHLLEKKKAERLKGPKVIELGQGQSEWGTLENTETMLQVEES